MSQLRRFVTSDQVQYLEHGLLRVPLERLAGADLFHPNEHRRTMKVDSTDPISLDEPTSCQENYPKRFEALLFSCDRVSLETADGRTRIMFSQVLNSGQLNGSWKSSGLE